MSEIFTLTENAMTRIDKLLQQDPGVFRISVDKAGCSGWKYVVEIAAAPHANDKEIKIQHLKIYLDGSSLKFLKGAQLDCVKKTLGTWQWIFNNPNVNHGCGCGESFSTK